MTFNVELTLQGPMTPELWEVAAPWHRDGFTAFSGRGRTRLEATMFAISNMRVQVKREYAPQVADWAQRGLDDLRCQSADPSAVETHVDQGTSMYATLTIGPLGSCAIV